MWISTVAMTHRTGIVMFGSTSAFWMDKALTGFWSEQIIHGWMAFSSQAARFAVRAVRFCAKGFSYLLQ
jgi:hypothetical protein